MAVIRLSVYGYGLFYPSDEPPNPTLTLETNKLYTVSAPQREDWFPSNPVIKYEIEVEANSSNIVVTTKKTQRTGKATLYRTVFSGSFSFDASGNLISGTVISINRQWALNGADVTQSQRSSIDAIELVSPLDWNVLNANGGLRYNIDYTNTVDTGRFSDKYFPGVQDKDWWQFNPFSPSVLTELEYSISITSSNQAINTVREGDAIQINLSTKNVPANSVIYWQISGTQGLNVNDLADQKLSESGKLDRNGKFSLTKTLLNDFKTEGDETLQISFFSDKALKSQVSTASVTIKDTSTDTLFASASTVLPAAYANLTLTGSSDINGTGNSFNNTVTGNNGKNILNGGAGRDRLTGLAGADTFRFTKLTDSLLATYDRVTDFTFGEDKIQGPASYLGKLNPQILNVADPRATTITRALTATAFKANTASILTCGSQTFIALNDNQAGFQTNKDCIVEITGYQGTLSVANMASSLL